MKPTVYVTDHVYSRVVGNAFASGVAGETVPVTWRNIPKLNDGPAVVYGILRGCGEIIKRCEMIGKDFYHIDHGYFRRSANGTYEGYYRITHNGLQVTDPGGQRDDRWGALDLEFRPWRRTGSNILVLPLPDVPPGRGMASFLGVDAQKWLDITIDEIKQHTDRQIRVKPKDAGVLNQALKDAWCVVTHSSVGAIDAVLAGIPAIATGPCAVKPVSWSFKDIENPHWPDREPWAWALAHHQFTLKEMESGEAWQILKS